MIRPLRALLAGVGAAVEVMCPRQERADLFVRPADQDDPETYRALQASGGGDVPAVPPTVSESTPTGTTIVDRRFADQDMTRRLAAAGFGGDVVEPPVWPFDDDFGRTTTCIHCRTMIRIDCDDNAYHVATGFYPCADQKHYASAD